jgi:hypothetical protein
MNSTINFLDHPGPTPNYELSVIIKLAGYIPENANFLEIGTMFGRTARAWYYHKPKTVNMTVVDNFDADFDTYSNFAGDPKLAEDAYYKSKNDKTTYYKFLELSNDFVNDITVINYVNVIDWPFFINYDFVYIDAGHNDNMVLAKIKKFLVPGNVIAGHDYCEEHPNVIDNCKKAAKKYKRRLILINDTSIWMLNEKKSYIFKKLKKENIAFTEIH